MTDDQFIEVEGEVIGWLVRFDDCEENTAIVHVKKFAEIERSFETWPQIILRWIGYDHEIIKRSTTTRGSDDEVVLGDHIRFRTTSSEQQDYMLWN